MHATHIYHHLVCCRLWSDVVEWIIIIKMSRVVNSVWTATKKIYILHSGLFVLNIYKQIFIFLGTGNYAAILFLRFPHLVIQLVNTFLFFKTILYCLRIKNEIHKINDTTKSEKKSSFKKDKERLVVLELFLQWMYYKGCLKTCFYSELYIFIMAITVIL